MVANVIIGTWGTSVNRLNAAHMTCTRVFITSKTGCEKRGKGT